MKSARFFSVIVFICACTNSLRAQPAAPEPPKDMDGIRKLFQDGKYQDLLRETSKALARKGDAARGFDQYELLTLKGEAHLHMKAWTLASDAFGAAATAAAKVNDDKKILTAQATQYLIKHSQNGVYKSKNAPTTRNGDGSPAGIDIIDPASRKDALKAVMNDELTKVTARVNSLKRATTLPPLMEAIGIVSDFRPLEMAATDSDTQSKQMLSELSASSVQMMNGGVTRMSANVERIATSANTRIVSVMNQQQIVRLQGLSGQDRQDLNEIISSCKQLIGATQTMASALGTTAGAEMTRIGTQAQALGTRATQVLNADYMSASPYR